MNFFYAGVADEERGKEAEGNATGQVYGEPALTSVEPYGIAKGTAFNALFAKYTIVLNQVREAFQEATFDDFTEISRRGDGIELAVESGNLGIQRWEHDALGR